MESGSKDCPNDALPEVNMKRGQTAPLLFQNSLTCLEAPRDIQDYARIKYNQSIFV